MEWHGDERVQLRYLRQILGHHKKTPVAAVYLESGVLTLTSRKEMRLLKLWAKVLITSNTHHLRQLYKKDKRKGVNGIWTKRIKAILIYYDLSHHWNNQTLEVEKRIGKTTTTTTTPITITTTTTTTTTTAKTTTTTERMRREDGYG